MGMFLQLMHISPTFRQCVSTLTCIDHLPSPGNVICVFTYIILFNSKITSVLLFQFLYEKEECLVKEKVDIKFMSD